jgi:DNA invertase Pin-like site-specific DNA recombinase
VRHPVTDIGYARVSTREQHDDSQVDALLTAGIARENIYVDKVTGKQAKRPQLDKALKRLGPGDVLVITRLSRAMRSLRHMLALADELKERGVGLRVLKQDIDTTTPRGRLVFHIFAAMDEFQRELIVEGTMEGLESARARGNVGGRPRALTNEQVRLVRRLHADGEGESVATIARMLGTSRPTIYRALEQQAA